MKEIFFKPEKNGTPTTYLDLKPDVILMDNFNYTDALMADKRGMTQKTI